MKIKKIISCLLAVTILVATLYCPATAVEDKDYSYKIDSSLAKKLDKMSDDDTIEVSVWVTDIDHNEVERQAIEKVKNSVSRDVFDIAKVDNDNSKLMELSRKETTKSVKEQKRDSSEIQKYIEVKRSLLYKSQRANIDKIISTLFPEQKPEIIYRSKYLPNIELKLQKSQIKRIVSFEEINDVFFIDNKRFFLKGSDNKTGESRTDYSEYTERNELIYRMIGSDVLKNQYGLSGSGVKIGSIDWYLPNTEYSCFNAAVNENRFHMVEDIGYNSNTYTNHHSYTTAIIIGKTNNIYEGIAPNVKMYCVADGNPNEILENNVPWKSRIDSLVDNGVNIIVAPTETYGEIDNTYGDSSKWIDALINATNVSFFQSAGNGNSGDDIIEGAMAYNSIVVGNFDVKTNTMSQNCSSYNTGYGSFKQYKPDISAPSNITTFFEADEISNGAGTSAAAPVAAGVACLLCEQYAILKISPSLLKAILINGTNYLGTENTVNNTNFIAFDRKSGAGIINGLKSNYCYYSYGWDTGNASSSFVGEYSVYVPKNKPLEYYVGKQVRVSVCAIKNNLFYNSSNIAESNVQNASVPLFKIEVWHYSNSSSVYTSEFLYDNKSSLIFSPPLTQKGTYNIKISRIDGGLSPTPCSVVYAYI